MIDADNQNGQVGTPGWGLVVTVALVSAAALVVEILAGRMLAPYLGMSLHTWTGVIACVLAGLSAGHWLGGYLDPGDVRRTEQRIAFILALAAVSVAVTPWLVRAVAPPVLSAASTPMMAVSALALALFFLPSLFAGVVSPLLTRLALDLQPARRARVLGRMYAAGALGGIAGTLGAGFVFLSWLGSVGTVVTVVGLYAVLAIVFALRSRRGSGPKAVAVAPAVVALAIAGLSTLAEAVCDVESNYYCLRVVDQAHETGRPSALLVIDHMGHGINDRDEPRWLHTTYAALTDRLLRLRGVSDRPFHAFFVGGGAYTLPRAWQKSFPDSTLVVAEVDPAVTQVAREHLWLNDAQSMEIHHVDARAWLQGQAAARHFDVIIGDAFHDLSVPAHLTTREFAQQVRARLEGEGSFYALTVIDRALRPAMLSSIVLTLQGEFSNVEVWVDESQWRTGARLTYLVLAAQSPTPATALSGRAPDDLASDRRWIQLGPDWLATHGNSQAAVLLTDEFAPVDRLMYPVFKEELDR